MPDFALIFAVLSLLVTSVATDENRHACSSSPHIIVPYETGILTNASNLNECYWTIHPTPFPYFKVKLDIRYLEEPSQHSQPEQRGSIKLGTVELKTASEVCYDNCHNDEVLISGCDVAEIYNFDVIASIVYEKGLENGIEIHYVTEPCSKIPGTTAAETSASYGASIATTTTISSTLALKTTNLKIFQNQTTNFTPSNYYSSSSTKENFEQLNLMSPYVIGAIVLAIVILLLILSLLILCISRKRQNSVKERNTNIDLSSNAETIDNVLYEACGNNFEKEVKDNVLYESYIENK
uniref:uncharacterized protein LOC120330154 n=1 Tax=Styela clava TaxID=7725 RepID=UPI00193A2131|nr:uncharacterized protein LOC120330154 [Styela clava]XP_039252939.1 uncharacterized protein LOC120330154 [Styela clava]